MQLIVTVISIVPMLTFIYFLIRIIKIEINDKNED